MSYQTPEDDVEDGRKKKRLQMQQLAHDADMKRVQRERESIAISLRRFERDLGRIESEIEDQKTQDKALADKEAFYIREIAHVKKQISLLR